MKSQSSNIYPKKNIIQLYSKEEKNVVIASLQSIGADEDLIISIVKTAESSGILVSNLVLEIVKTGKLMNPRGLDDLLKQIKTAIDSAKGDMQEIERLSSGYIWELDYALKAANSGDVKSIQLGSEDGEGGDLVVRSEDGELETVQIKLVTGTTAKAVKKNIRAAIKQLGGIGGETANTSGRRVADITVLNQLNELTILKPEDRLKNLETYIYDVDLSNVDYIFVRLSFHEKIENYSFSAKDKSKTIIETT